MEATSSIAAAELQPGVYRSESLLVQQHGSKGYLRRLLTRKRQCQVQITVREIKLMICSVPNAISNMMSSNIVFVGFLVQVLSVIYYTLLILLLAS